MAEKRFSEGNRYLMLIFVVSYLAILLYAINTKTFGEGLKVFGLGVLISIASLGIGGILGFIFGIPSPKNTDEGTYERNTSLKQVSDWLTKIIIGVSLVELKSIIKYFNISTNHISELINVEKSVGVYVASIIVAFSIIGFMLVYILTVTMFFQKLVTNDNLIKNLINDAEVNPDEVIISESIKKDFNLNLKEKSQVLDYVSKHGVKINDAYAAKRLAKILFHMKEYEHSVLAYAWAFTKDKEDVNLKINEAFIRNKFLKQFEESNRILLEIVASNPELPNPYYNLACNYNREYKEVVDENNYREYKNELKTKIEYYLSEAFRKDKGLLSEALKDGELDGVDIQTIFGSI